MTVQNFKPAHNQLFMKPTPLRQLTYLHEECCVLNGGCNSFGN